ncbi:DUF1801 domain-containing protein [Flavobacterium sp. GNP001]
MAKANKTTETEVNITDFINSYVDNDQKKIESFQLVELMSKWSGTKPKMWGPTIIGFGNYHYTYASGHEGESMLIGFSPRKAAFSLYVTTETHDNQELLGQLGKFKMGKACIYVKKLADINIEIFEQICCTTIEKIKQSN